MAQQLQLLDCRPPVPWQLDARTRRIGRRGVADARRALESALRPSDPADLRRAG